MAQNIITLASQETSEEILREVGLLKTEMSLLKTNINRNLQIAEAGSGIYGRYEVNGNNKARTDSTAQVLFELPDDGVERYLISATVTGSVHSVAPYTYRESIGIIEADGKVLASVTLSSTSAGTTTGYVSSVTVLCSDIFSDGTSDSNNYLGIAASGSDKDIYVYAKAHGNMPIPFHTLRILGCSAYQTGTYTCKYLERKM